MQIGTVNGQSKFEYLFLGIAGALIFMVNYMCVNGYGGFAIILSVFYLILVASQPTESALLYIALVVPSTRSMEIVGVSVAVWVCLLYLIKKIFVNKGSFHMEILIPMGVYLIYCLQFYYRFDSVMYGFLQPLKMLIVLFFLYEYAIDGKSYINKASKISKILFVWLSGAVLALLPVLMTTNVVGRIQAFNNDSNILSVQTVFILSCASVLLMKNNKGMSFFSYTVVVVVSMAICLICGSRNGFLLLLILFASMIVLNLNDKRFVKSVVILVTIILLITIALNTSFVQMYISGIQHRLDLLEQSGNVSNGRYDIWNEYISVFNNSIWLWFLGLGTYSNYGLAYMAHNMFIEDISNYGIIGMLILYYAYARIFFTVYKVNMSVRNCVGRPRLFGVIPFIIPLVGGLTLHSMTSLPNTLMLYIGVAMMTISCEKAAEL